MSGFEAIADAGLKGAAAVQVRGEAEDGPVRGVRDAPGEIILPARASMLGCSLGGICG